MREQKITVPTVGTNPGFTAMQSYVYDSLNRKEEEMKGAIRILVTEDPPDRQIQTH
ncbi:MAG: hypothetical protein ABI857_02670 [Acidobacteriota bacterium]